MPVRDQLALLGTGCLILIIAVVIGGLFQGTLPVFLIAAALQLAILRKVFAQRLTDFMRRFVSQMSISSQNVRKRGFHLAVSAVQLVIGLAVALLAAASGEDSTAAMAGIVAAFGLNGFFMVSDLSKSGFYE